MIRDGNYYCDVCQGLIFDPRDAVHRQIGTDDYSLCGVRCTRTFEKRYPHAQISMGRPLPPAPKEPERKGADEQPGWKMHRWWNQTYKRKKDVWEQKKVQREFRKIQRKARRSA